ncbi:MAG: LPXTG cell wall anchor domain-containing protein [Clostridia bacterium]|nr:LPXTG cell wall anchor domain-containing protein [Clostridia bacterium]
MKKLITIVLAMVMVLSLCTLSAFADGLRDFDSAKGDKLSYDQILVNGAEIANGNSAVIAAKTLVDGSDGSVSTIALHGWFGNANAKIASYGYTIDDGEPVYGDFAAAAEQDVINAGGESRYTVTVDVSGLQDGAEHMIWVVVKLDNGDIVKLNRYDNRGQEGGKDREVYVNYKAPLTETQPSGEVIVHGASFDSFFVNDVLNFGEGDGGASGKLDNHDRTVDGSDGSVTTITLRGWIGFEGQGISQFGYQVGDSDPIFSDSNREERGDIGAIRDPANGGEFADAYKIVIDTTNIKGTNNVIACVKLADGTVVKIDENVKRNGEGTTPNTSFTFVGPAVPEKTFSRKDIGTGTAIGVWLQGDNDTATLEFTTAGAFNGFGLPIYWASNAGVPNGPFGKYKVELFKFAYNPEYTLSQAPVKSYELDGQGDNNPAFDFVFDEALKAGTYIVRITLTNKDEILVGKMNGQGDDVEMTPYIVLPKMDANPDASKFAFSTADAFNLYVLAEDGVEDFFAANPENTDAPADPPQTGDAAVAMFAVLAILAMGAVVVFAKKRSF